MRRGQLQKRLCLLGALALCLGLLGCAGKTEAEPTPEETPTVTAAPTPLPAAHSTQSGYDDVRVYYDGLLTDRGYRQDGAVYLDPEPLCREEKIALENRADEEGFTIRLAETLLTGKRGQEYFTADSRYLYAPEGWLTVEGRALLPADTFSRVLGVTVTVSEDGSRVDVDTYRAKLLPCGPDYYSRFSEDDVYWLAHIIFAEAGRQPLAGQIGVGNVVLNRVDSEIYPDTVKGVILQRGEKAQFDPVDDGGINKDPDEQAIIAAYLALDGYNTVGDSMYFVNPRIGNTSWFKEWKTFVISIGDHDFYA